jgi:3-oxoacyl-ACP reductase-like protein
VASAAAATGSAVAAWVGGVAVRAASAEDAAGVPAGWQDVLAQLLRLRLGLTPSSTPAAVSVAVSEDLLQRIDLLIREASRRARRS